VSEQAKACALRKKTHAAMRTHAGTTLTNVSVHWADVDGRRASCLLHTIAPAAHLLTKGSRRCDSARRSKVPECGDEQYKRDERRERTVDADRTDEIDLQVDEIDRGCHAQSGV
jgi:hypothetical protein